MPSYSKKREIINSTLLILLGFSLPLSTASSNILGILLLISWASEGNYRNKIKLIWNNNISKYTIIYLLCFIIGSLWSRNIELGLEVARHQWKILLIPLLLTLSVPPNRKIYINSFLASMLITLIISYLIFFRILTLNGVPLYNPSPFMSHIIYTPFLAFTAYLLTYYSSQAKKITIKSTYLLLFAATTVLTFITAGRTGYIAYFGLMFLFGLQQIRRNSIIHILPIITLIPLLIITTYNISPSFQNRLEPLKEYFEGNPHKKFKGVTVRKNFALNTWEIFLKNPIFGVGTGDFREEFSKINQERTPSSPKTNNPHNQYLYVGATLGLFGLIPLFLMFYSLYKNANKLKDEFKPLRHSLILFFLVIMLGESYLSINASALFFSYFAAILYAENPSPS